MIGRSFLSLVAAAVACLLSREGLSSTVTPISVPLSKAVADSRLIVIASVERVANQSGLRYFEVRIEEVLKSRDAAPKELQRTTIAVFDPQEKFYHDHADLIAAGVISFVDSKYPTKVQQIAAGDRLVFFLAGRGLQSSLPPAYFLVCGRAYDGVGIKPTVLKRLK
jgi:hypothetical protein